MKLPEFVFRGQINAHGLLLEKRKGIRSHILKLWQTGFSLYEHDKNYVLMFNQTLILDTSSSQGFAIKKSKSGFTTGEWPESSESNRHSILHLLHGNEIYISIDDEYQVLPSDWFELSDFNIAEVRAFASTISKPVQAESKVGKDSRALFGKEYKASAAQTDALKSMVENANKTAQREGLVSRLREGSKAIASAISLGGTKSNRAENTTNGTSGSDSGNAGDQTQMSLLDKIREKILTSRLGSIVGKQNARYLQKMMDMLDDGNFEEGLRRAIPLDSGDFTSQSKTAGFLSARNELSFGGSSAGGGNVNLGMQFHQHLQNMYERTFKKLDNAGRFKEAAFVKAELLKQNDAAITYLESKKMYQLAAELAESRAMPVTRIIRQWLLAGNKERAIWFAVASGEFISAIALLENRDKKLADKLRELAVERYIATGRYIEAIEIGWPINRLRAELLNLLDRMALDNSVNAMSMRVKGISLDCDKSESYALELIAFFEDRSASSAIFRQQTINELAKISKHSAALNWVAKEALKSLYHDISAGNAKHDKKVEESLLALLTDEVFRFDVKRSKLIANIKQNDLLHKVNPPILQIEAKKIASTIVDIVLLQADHCLVALGDMGMLLTDQTGKVVKRYNQPVDSFIVSDDRLIILCLSHRDSYLQAFEFDWLSKSLQSVGEYQFSAYASNYDGALWFVAEGKSLYCIDLKSDDKKIFWRVNDLPGEIVYIKKSDNHINVIIEDGSCLQYWRYRFPDLTLAAREPVNKVVLENAHLFCLSDDGEFILTAIYNSEENVTKIKATWYLSDSSPTVNKNYVINDLLGRLTSMKSINKWMYLNRQFNEELEFNLIENKTQAGFKPKLIVKTDVQQNMLFSEFSGRLLLNSSGSFVLLDSFSGRIYNSYSIS